MTMSFPLPKTRWPDVQSYVTVLQIAAGRITRFRDYFDPLAVLAASGMGELDKPDTKS